MKRRKSVGREVTLRRRCSNSSQEEIGPARFRSLAAGDVLNFMDELDGSNAVRVMSSVAPNLGLASDSLGSLVANTPLDPRNYDQVYLATNIALDAAKATQVNSPDQPG
jgi:hypothetical protein